MLGIGELALVLLVIVVVLSIKRLPDLVRSAGKAARILKSEKRALKEHEASRAAPGAQARAHEAPHDAARPSPHVIRGEATERGDR
ncbi:twin-arginine translocase TatA/TatE family subunit [Streptomyces sp. NPDC101181]|uniref:twin-arginine translocase TatA/TatE family subunit n=1 Tax=Streptomyces sp. NPDC101181 TaxID=3366125 RepID=UPI00381D50CB